MEYPESEEEVLRKSVVSLSSYPHSSPPPESGRGVGAVPVVGFIGAGNYASRTLIPAFKKAGAVLDTLVTSGGISEVTSWRKGWFQNSID